MEFRVASIRAVQEVGCTTRTQRCTLVLLRAHTMTAIVYPGRAVLSDAFFLFLLFYPSILLSRSLKKLWLQVSLLAPRYKHAFILIG